MQLNFAAGLVPNITHNVAAVLASDTHHRWTWKWRSHYVRIGNTNLL